MADVFGVNKVPNVESSIGNVDYGQMEFVFHASQSFPFNRP